MACIQQIERYLAFEADPILRGRFIALSDEQKELVCRRNIRFGTAGLRGQLDVGSSNMNIATVTQAAQGICSYYVSHLGLETCREQGCFIGYDARAYSKFMAVVSAAVFLAHKIPVYMPDTFTITPLCSHSVVSYGAFVGIQVTASHNPQQDHGYKVFGSNGAQIVNPVDAEIYKEIQAQSSPLPELKRLVNYQEQALCANQPELKYLRTNIFQCWLRYLATIKTCLNLSSLSEFKSKIVYTAMHGVGHKYVEDLLVCQLGLPQACFIPVPEQTHPDPKFSTVKLPNPEENGATDMALQLAKEEGARIIILNDPDADRFLALELQADGNYYQFTGDELGALFLLLKLERVADPSQFTAAASVVSSSFHTRVAEQAGFTALQTLTGFKWLAGESLKCNSKDSYAYEEAIGYALALNQIPDKDGVSAIPVFLTKAQEMYTAGRTVKDYLVEEMQKYKSCFATCNSYYRCPDPCIVGQVLSRLREDGYPKEILGHKITRVIDLLNYVDTEKGIPSLPKVGEDMIILYFDNGCILKIRGSGTEPKLKYYSELVHESDIEYCKRELPEMVRGVMDTIVSGFGLEHA